MKNLKITGLLMSGVFVGMAQGANIRYQLSGDYFGTVANTGTHGWQAGGGGAGGAARSSRYREVQLGWQHRDSCRFGS
jgi:hypothetical protein